MMTAAPMKEEDGDPSPPPPTTSNSVENDDDDDDEQNVDKEGDVNVPTEKTSNGNPPTATNDTEETEPEANVVNGDATPTAATSADDDDDNDDDTKENTNTTSTVEESSQQNKNKNQQDQQDYAMSLDVAYQSLESVRRLNVQVEFGMETGIQDNQCVLCLREKVAAEAAGNSANNNNNNKFNQWRSNRQHKQQQNAQPCLTCGTPVCKKNQHQSKEFSKQNTTICCHCLVFFSTSQTIQQLCEHHEEEESHHTNTNNSQQQRFNHILEVYDRALLILKYSLQYVDEVASALEGNTSRHNKIGLGSSATGVVAGGLGVAAACTILTPVGPPLLLASILFGGGATAVTAGSEAVNYRCEPNKMADRILTLYGLVQCIYTLPSAMSNMLDNNNNNNIEGGIGGALEPRDENGNPLSISSSGSNASLHWTRVTMNAVKPLTAGALSAISIVTEARELNKTVSKIRAGNPCEKAERLRAINLSEIPTTNDLLQPLELALEQYQTRQKELEIDAAAAEAAAAKNPNQATLLQEAMDANSNNTTDASVGTSARRPLGWRFGRSASNTTTSTASDDDNDNNNNNNNNSASLEAKDDNNNNNNGTTTTTTTEDANTKKPLGWRFRRGQQQQQQQSQEENGGTTNDDDDDDNNDQKKKASDIADESTTTTTTSTTTRMPLGWRFGRGGGGAPAETTSPTNASTTTSAEPSLEGSNGVPTARKPLGWRFRRGQQTQTQPEAAEATEVANKNTNDKDEANNNNNEQQDKAAEDGSNDAPQQDQQQQQPERASPNVQAV